MLKHCEFEDACADELKEFWQPLKNARYLVCDLHKDLPLEEWPKVEVPAEKRHEIRRALILAERKFKTLRRSAFRDFRQIVTAQSLRVLNRNISQLTSTQSLRQATSTL
jgi:hypothetical protein